MRNMLRLHPLYHSHTKILHIKLPFSSNFLVSMAMPFNSNSLLSSTKPFLPSFSTFTCLNNSRFQTPPNTLIRSTHSTNSHPLSLRTSPLSSAARSTIPPPVSLEGSTRQTERLTKLMMKLKELGFEGYNPMPGQYRLLCPMCSGGDSGEKSLSLNISADGNNAVWICFRGKCGWQGNTMAIGDVLPTTGKSKQIIKATKRVLTKDSLSLEPLCNELLVYFAERMITASTLRRNHVMQQKNGNKVIVAFTYMRDKALVGCKYRDENKNFWQEKDTEKIFYGLDDIRNATDIIIVEGEVDKLSLEEAGFLNCVSVPDGSPPKVRGKDLPSPDQDTEYQYLWNCKEYFEKASRIILATDGDQPGQALAEELARRLGRERCWRVKWPKKNEVDHFKDANEVLTFLGRERLIETIESAELYPIQGLFYFRDYFPEIDAYYHRVLGDELGLSSGWRCLDEYYNVVPGELTIVTGIPNSGKSEWIDALLCNLNESVGWKFVLCSMENKVREHARKLMEKHLKKPFFDVRYGETAERMTVEELEQGKEWLDNTFHLIRCENDSLPSIKWVLQLAKAAVLRYGVRGLVIDPYNELDHQRNKGMTETEYVSQMLTMVKRFAQHYSCHVWFVAHPKQLQNWKGTVPNMYDISGSAHFINKCDNGIVVHRNRDPEAGPIDRVQICVKKVRNKVAGTIGEAFLTYNRITGEFVDLGS